MRLFKFLGVMFIIVGGSVFYSQTGTVKLIIHTVFDGIAPGDASKAFPFQFGSISPGFMNGMQVFLGFSFSVFPLKATFVISYMLVTEVLSCRFLLERAQLLLIWMSRSVTRCVCFLTCML